MGAEHPEPRGSCPPAEQLTHFVRRELFAAERAFVEGHLGKCEPCRVVADSLERTIERLRIDGERRVASASRALSAPRHAAILELAARAGASSRSHRRRRWIAAAAAVVLGVVGLAVFLLDRSPTAPQLANPQPAPRASWVEVMDRARTWLAKAQSVDGGWDTVEWKGDERYRVALSALALLALAPGGGEHDSETVRAGAYVRGERFLLAEQQDGGRFGAAFRGSLYNQGLAIVALLETSVGQPRSEVATATESAIELLLRHQRPEGAWGYLEGDASRGPVDVANESITYWAVRALLAARSAPFGAARSARFDEAAARGLDWLASRGEASGRSVSLYRGRSGHDCGGDSGGTFAALALLLDAPGLADVDPTARRDLHRALDRVLRSAAGADDIDFYHAYLRSRVLASTEATAAGARARGENRRRLVAAQVSGGPLAGSWAPVDRWGPVGGRLYSTALAALALATD